ncbi:MAG: hypothetical protein KDE47_28130 [Caldilineaceae bacterium]|nr:hypothetical protein [Caldilineaceae bacterium]
MINIRSLYRLCVLLVVVAMVTMQSRPLFAQAELPRVICDQLADEDCVLLRRSRQAMNAVTTAHTHLQTLFQLADMPSIAVNGEAVEIPALAVEVDVESAYSFDERTAEQLQTLVGIDQNAMALAAMVAPDSILQLFAGLTAETQIRIRVSEAVQQWLSAESGQTFPAEIHLHVLVVENMLYIELQSIAAAIGSLAPPAVWGVVDLADLWAMPAADAENLRPATVMAFVVGILMARNDEQLVAYYEDLQKLRALDRQLAPGRIIRVERGDDQTINGITVNSFTTKVDVRQLATWVATLVQKMLDSVGQEPEPEVTVALTMGLSILTGVESTIVAYIEPATARVHRQESALVWDFTPFMAMASLLADQGGSDFQIESEPGTTPQLILRAETDYDYATPVIVDSPEDLIPVPLAEVFGRN